MEQNIDGYKKSNKRLDFVTSLNLFKVYPWEIAEVITGTKLVPILV